jgi:protein-disulfide isomerase
MERTASGGPGKSARGYWIAVPFAAAWILSAMSWLGICSDGCEETHLYRLFGFPLSPLGVGYFTLCGLAFLTRNRFRFSGFLIPLLLSGALGSEFVLVWIQKYVIGRWCPLCLGIALSVVTACVLISLERLPGVAIQIRGGERNLEMKRLAGKTVLILFAFLAGMGGTAMGLKKPDAFAAGLSVNSLAFGNTESSLELYIVTDWFCPACRTAEPEILKGVRKVMQQAKVVFVDYPIHPETLNYIPYNLSFILREKEKYLQIREALATLARKTKEPMPEDVQAAVSPLGVKYVPLNYADVLAGMQYFSTLAKKFNVPGTPSLVVRDLRTGKTKTLFGSSDISSDNIMKTLAEVSGK